MSDYTVHLVKTVFYDVPVVADDADEAYTLALDVMNDSHIDRKSVGVELAGWCADPIEETHATP